MLQIFYVSSWNLVFKCYIFKKLTFTHKTTFSINANSEKYLVMKYFKSAPLDAELKLVPITSISYKGFIYWFSRNMDENVFFFKFGIFSSSENEKSG
jgi:hypothetical protein